MRHVVVKQNKKSRCRSRGIDGVAGQICVWCADPHRLDLHHATLQSFVKVAESEEMPSCTLHETGEVRTQAVVGPGVGEPGEYDGLQRPNREQNDLPVQYMPQHDSGPIPACRRVRNTHAQLFGLLVYIFERRRRIVVAGIVVAMFPRGGRVGRTGTAGKVPGESAARRHGGFEKICMGLVKFIEDELRFVEVGGTLQTGEEAFEVELNVLGGGGDVFHQCREEHV
ncbi:hypothetical protein B0H19DRAFT_1147274 [Mycena capillaripes]|nr:hypothetical protein B0H19DRAFT_1147274 [Mycena capillaripes]